MKLHEALATGLPFRRDNGPWLVPGSPTYTAFTESLMSESWEVKQRDVTITRAQLIDAYVLTIREAGITPTDAQYDLVSRIAKQLGLGE